MDEPLRILILEDNAGDAALIELELRDAGIAFQSRRVETREEYARALEEFVPQLILSDYTLPGFDGISALAMAQARCPDIPFLFVAGTLGEELAVDSLKGGATDYVLKHRLSLRLVPSVRRALLEADERRRRRSAEDQLQRNALSDALTGLPNRALFLDRIGRAIGLAKRRDDYAFAVLFLDLDRFRMVNDSLGHLVGDQLLVEIARRLERCLHPGDTVARLGGDEFTVLLEDIQDVGDAIHMSERILTDLALPFNVGGHEVFTSASVGIALSATGYDLPEDLVRDADTALHRAKTLGRGRYQVWDKGMHSHAVSFLQLESDLRRALERGEFLLYYQPIVSLRTGRISGCEALARWEHPTRGRVPPTEFIPMAEETGLIGAIGERVLRAACAQNKAWRDLGLPSLYVSVNLSPRQFRQRDLTEGMLRILQEASLEPRALKVELTESAIMDNPEEAIATLRHWKSIGFQLSLDDFGTGHSSLSHLRYFPFDTLKIDRSFVQDIGKNPEDAAVATAIIALARALNLKVLAEGVASPAQIAFLRSQQCDEAQGDLVSPPMPAETMTKLLRQKSGASWLE